MATHRRTTLLTTLLLVSVFACGPERPPGADQVRAQRAAMQRPAGPDGGGQTAAGKTKAATAHFDPSSQTAILSFAGERGKFADTDKLDAVPDEAKGMVRIKLLEGPRAPAGMVWVTNLSSEPGQQGYKLETVPREMFEELALGLGRKSKVELPGDLEAPEVVPAAQGVIVYKTDWCGVCKKVEKYLKRKGVEYIAKDIEKDRSAASELAAKAKQKGVPMGSVPMIAIGDELLVGFDRKRIEALLAG